MALLDPNAAPTGVRRAIASQNTPDGSTVPGLFDATKANFESSSEGMQRAQGLGQTVGATVGGAAKIAGGLVLDAGRDLVTNPLRATGAFLSDAYRGATNPGAPADPAVQAQPSLRPAGAPTAPAAALAVENPYGGIAGVAGTTDGSGNLTLSNTRPATTENQQFQAQADAQRQRMLQQTEQVNFNNRQTELAQDAVDTRNAFAAKAAGDAQAAKGIDDWNARVGAGYSPAGVGAGVRGGGPQTAAQLNAAVGHERNAVSQQIADTQAAASMRGQDIAAGAQHYAADTGLAGQQLNASARMAQLGYDRFKSDREFGRQTGNDAIANESKAQDDFSKRLASMHTSVVDGKPVVDADTVANAQKGVGTAIASLKGNGVTGIKDLAPAAQQQLLAGSSLLAKMQSEGSNYNPLKPDYLKTTNPLDLVNLRRLPNGDAQITNPKSPAFGQTIPARILNKVNSDRIGGTPTSDYDILFPQNDNGVR